jgi:hypothetical protein
MPPRVTKGVPNRTGPGTASFSITNPNSSSVSRMRPLDNAHFVQGLKFRQGLDRWVRSPPMGGSTFYRW